MKVVFADTFFDSLERMIKKERWYWKIWDFFRYDTSKGIKNLIFFFPVIWKFRSWDSNFQLSILKRSLEPLHKTILNGNEVDESRLKKAAMIERAIQILENMTEDKYIEMAEKELGYETNTEYLFDDNEPQEIKDANMKIYKLSNEIEEKEWKELWRIFEGQNHSQYVMLCDKARAEGEEAHNLWAKWFDGTGMKGWWD